MSSDCSGVKFRIPQLKKKIQLKQLNPEKLSRRRRITLQKLSKTTNPDDSSPQKEDLSSHSQSNIALPEIEGKAIEEQKQNGGNQGLNKDL